MVGPVWTLARNFLKEWSKEDLPGSVHCSREGMIFSSTTYEGTLKSLSNKKVLWEKEEKPLIVGTLSSPGQFGEMEGLMATAWNLRELLKVFQV